VINSAKQAQYLLLRAQLLVTGYGVKGSIARTAHAENLAPCWIWFSKVPIPVNAIQSKQRTSAFTERLT